MIKIIVTVKEASVLNAMVSLIYAECGFTDITFDDIHQANTMKLSKASTKGVISSLQTKGYIILEQNDDGLFFYNFGLYASGLVKPWVNEASYIKSAEIQLIK